jgi:hypothetical protein
MSLLAETLESTAREIVLDPRSVSAEASVARMIQGIDEFLASSLLDQFLELDAEQRAPVLVAFVVQVRSLIAGLRDMLSVAVQAEQRGDPPMSWAPHLADAIRRLEDEFEGIPNLGRMSPPPIVVTDPVSGELRVEEQRVAPREVQSSTESAGSSDDELIEDTADLIEARNAVVLAKSRGERRIPWESLRNELDDD